MNEKQESVANEELEKSLAKAKRELAKKEKENKAIIEKQQQMERQLAELAQMMEKSQSSGISSIVDAIKVGQQEELIYVGSHGVDGVTVHVNGRDEFILNPIPLTSDDVAQIIKVRTYYKMFENGILYFEDEENYAKFRLSSKNILSNENIIKIFDTSDSEQILADLKRFSENKNNMGSTHNLLFKIAILWKNGDITLNTEKLEVVEKYFATDLQYVVKQIPYMKFNK